jgi:hypothetical protein
MCVIFLDFPNDDRLREISIKYQYHYAVYTSNSGWSGSTVTESFLFIVSRVNIHQVLGGQNYRGYPVWQNVSLWTLSSIVNIGGVSANITDETNWRGHDCWRCDIDEATIVYYDKNSGLLLQSISSTAGGDVFTDLWMYTEEITLSSVNYAGLYAIEVKQTGVILAAIFAELAVITWLIARRLRKKTE